MTKDLKDLRNEMEEKVPDFQYDRWADGSRNRGPRKFNPDLLDSVRRMFEQQFKEEE